MFSRNGGNVFLLSPSPHNSSPPAALLDVAGVQAGGGGGCGLLLVPPAQRLLQELGHVPAANLETVNKVSEHRASLQCWSRK